jgi:hypothetical protein
MKYESLQRDEKPAIDRILSMFNFLLFLIIIFCLNYMFVSFLFH